MAAKDQDDPTGGDFNTALEESIQLVSKKNLTAAKNKWRAFKGVITRLIGQCTESRNVIVQACPEDDETSWNKTLLLQPCDASGPLGWLH